VAGFLIGLAMERWDLHLRICYKICGLLGHRIDTLMAGFMITTFFLSMWVENTAVTLTMIPVLSAFLDTISDEHRGVKIAFLCIICWSSTVGGFATPVGTPNNGIVLIYFQNWYPTEEPLTFADMFAFVFPLAIIMQLAMWIFLSAKFVWFAKKQVPLDREFFNRKYAELGPWTYEQIWVWIILCLLILAWMLADPIGQYPGWADSVSEEIDLTVIGLIFTLPLFFIPCSEETRAAGKGQYLIDWKEVKGKFAWEIFWLVGGGFMLGQGANVSGFATVLAESLGQVDGSVMGFMCALILMIMFFTEFLSGMAMCTLMAPVMVALADVKGFNSPSFLIMTGLISTFSFSLPMGAGPNMVVYITGKITMMEMCKEGLWMNLIAWGVAMFFYPVILLPQLSYMDNYKSIFYNATGSNATGSVP
jgi:sodium-dependent dicarboxylate transporter 2/3/5